MGWKVTLVLNGSHFEYGSISARSPFMLQPCALYTSPSPPSPLGFSLICLIGHRPPPHLPVSRLHGGIFLAVTQMSLDHKKNLLLLSKHQRLLFNLISTNYPSTSTLIFRIKLYLYFILLSLIEVTFQFVR